MTRSLKDTVALYFTRSVLRDTVRQHAADETRSNIKLSLLLVTSNSFHESKNKSCVSENGACCKINGAQERSNSSFC
jgi:hypothetical protein